MENDATNRWHYPRGKLMIRTKRIERNSLLVIRSILKHNKIKSTFKVFATTMDSALHRSADGLAKILSGTELAK